MGQKPQFSAVDRPQSEARGHTLLRGEHGHAKTALNTGLFQGTGASRARSNSCRFPRLCATESTQNRLWWCHRAILSGDTPIDIRFCEHDTTILVPRTAPREGRTLPGITPRTHLPQDMHSLWTSVWKNGHTMLGRQTDRRGWISTTDAAGHDNGSGDVPIVTQVEVDFGTSGTTR